MLFDVSYHKMEGTVFAIGANVILYAKELV